MARRDHQFASMPGGRRSIPQILIRNSICRGCPRKLKGTRLGVPFQSSSFEPFPKSSCPQRVPCPMRAILDVILAILDIYWFIIIATAVLSWLVAFNVINVRNDLVRTVWDTLNRLTEPVLRPIRERLPNMGGVDISPIIVLLII